MLIRAILYTNTLVDIAVMLHLYLDACLIHCIHWKQPVLIINFNDYDCEYHDASMMIDGSGNYRIDPAIILAWIVSYIICMSVISLMRNSVKPRLPADLYHWLITH